jgi:class 3 adenylate cyclase
MPNSNYYLQIAQVYDALNQRDTAKVYYETTLQISKKIKWPYTEADAYLGLGKYEVDINQNYRKANQYATDAYKLFQAMEGEKPGLISSLNLLSHINWHLKKYEEAKKYAEEAVLIAEEIDQYEGIREGYQNLFKISQDQGEYKHALEHYVAAINANDSIINLARDKNVQDLTIKHEADLKDVEIENQQNQIAAKEEQSKLLRLIYLIGALGLVALGYFILTRQKLGQAKKAAEYEKSISTALNKFVPRSFLKALGYNNILEVKLGDQIEQEVSIVFTDIRSFTTISENLTPSDNFKFVKRYAEKMGPVIIKNGGFINQYLGDGIMAIFQSSPNDALNACIEMQRAVEEFNQDTDQLPNGNPIAVGMGIHTGSLVMGIIGDETRQDAAIISDTVNTAARLEGLTKPYGTPILLSEVSYNKLENRENHSFRYLGQSQVKGKADAIKIYECIDGRSSIDQPIILEYSPLFEAAVKSFEQESYKESKSQFEILQKSYEIDKAITLYLEKMPNQKK